MAIEDRKLPETEDGTIIYNLDPIIIKHHYEIDYIHSYAQDSPFFAGLAEKKLLGSRCPKCDTKFGTPRSHCMECGAPTEWMELPHEGFIHTWTTCHFGSEEFLDECPFHLALIEWPGVHTFFLTRVIGVPLGGMRIGMKVRARFRRLSKFKPTDVYFVPAD